jgi:hypothetical protein
MGDLVYTHGAGGNSLVRRFKKPTNPQTALQRRQRDKFTVAQGLYLRGFNDYNAALNAAGRALLTPYLSAVSRFKSDNPVETKEFANGFESGKVLNRDYAIGHSLRNDLYIRLNEADEVENTTAETLTRRIVR